MKILRSLLPVTLLNGIALLVITLQLPNSVPVHMNIAMEIDGMGSRWWVAVFGLVPIVLSFAFLLYRHFARNSQAVAQNRRVENVLIPVIIALITIMTWLPVSLAFQDGMGAKMTLPLSALMMFLLGVFMVIISNFMGIIKPNKTLGIRTVWTLKSERVWKKTHRLGGLTGVAGGVLICIFSVLGLITDIAILPIIGFLPGLTLTAIVPIVYSYIAYKKERP